MRQILGLEMGQNLKAEMDYLGNLSCVKPLITAAINCLRADLYFKKSSSSNWWRQ